MTRDIEAELMARLFKTAASGELGEMRHVVRSIYGAMCVDAGIDKQTALAEFADHWDKFEALVCRINRTSKLN